MTTIEPGERRIAVGFLAVAFALRALYAFHYRIDTDEPQHLHVAWGWAHGLVQYRDVFDNHMPLFHLLTAPLVRVLGERSDIVPLMRLAMLPLYALTLWCTYRLGRRLFSARAGWWAAVLLAFLPPFFRCSLEFRADDLWAPLWLLGLVIAVEGERSAARLFLAGVVVGAAVGVSMKTSLLIATLVVASAVALALRPARPIRRSLRSLGVHAALFAAGVVVVPAALAAIFFALGAWEPFVYGTIHHNILPDLGTWRHGRARMLLSPAIIALGAVAGMIVSRRTADASLARRRIAMLLAAVAYGGALAGVWPLITREDYLPFYPMVAIMVAPAALALGPVRWRRIAWVPLAIVTFELVVQLTAVPPWLDHAQRETDFVADVLRLTRPGDSVFDLKGETIFRPRAFYWVLEYITKVRLERGLIADTIPERLVATATHVAILDCGQLPPRARRFLAAHYLSVGSLRVAGERLPCAEGEVTPFEVVIPGAYRVVEDGAAPAAADGGVAAAAAADAPRVEVDGEPFDAEGVLAPGTHQLRTHGCRGSLVLVWAPAVERGFSPLAVPVAEVAWRAS